MKFAQVLSAATKSWKTTVLAILAALTEWGVQIQAYLNPDVTPDWNQAVTLTIVAAALLFSRDADKTSEDSGVNK